MRAKRNPSGLLMVLVLSAGCASSGTPASRGWGISEPNRKASTPVRSTTTSTPSGKPEVLIPGSSKKSVTDALVNQMIAQGYSIGKIDDYKAQFEKPGGFWLDLLAGSRFNSTAVWRISYSLVETEGGVRVLADMGAVTNPGSGFERITVIKGGKNAAAVQSILDAVKNETARIVLPEPTVQDTSVTR